MKKTKNLIKNFIAQKLLTFGLVVAFIINIIFIANKAFGASFAKDSFYDFMSKQEHIEQEIDDFQIQIDTEPFEADFMNLENVILILFLSPKSK